LWGESHGGKGPALYDLNGDRGETTNVVEQHRDVVEEMRSLIGEVFELPATASA
jgi:hypothetical protein